MKLSVSYTALEQQRQKIGAARSQWSINAAPITPRDTLLAELKEGIVVKNIKDIKVVHGKLLSYKGEQILLYIRDTGKDRFTLENSPENASRFHIADCRTLEKMRKDGRGERYVFTNRTDGQFKVDWKDSVSYTHLTLPTIYSV